MTSERAAALLALADRVEAASGPDRELDGAIDRLLNSRPKDGDYDPAEMAIWRVRDSYSGLLVRGDGFARGSFCAREYSASLDAAVSLVPEGWDWSVTNSGTCGAWSTDGAEPITLDGMTFPGVAATVSVKAATPALALTAAALRAHAAQMGGVE